MVVRRLSVAIAIAWIMCVCAPIEGDQRLATESAAGSDAGLEPLTPNNACVNLSYGVDDVELAMMLVIDRSGSMRALVEPETGTTPDDGETDVPPLGDGTSNSNRWVALSRAIVRFAESSANTPKFFVGAQLFPLEASSDEPYACATLCTNCSCVIACGCNGCSCSPGCVCRGGTYSCDAAQYREPALAFTSANAAAPALTKLLNSQEPAGGTPTRVAIESIAEYTKDWLKEHARSKAVIVLATDGVPTASLCRPNSISDSVRVVAALSRATPAIETFVIGVGGALETLNEIAVAGGTEEAFFVDNSSDLDARFFEILERVRRRMLSCTLSVSAPPNSELEWERVKLRLGNAEIPEVPNQNGCSLVSGGFYYAADGAGREITLCQPSCDTFRSTLGSKLDLLMGCRSSAPR